AFEQLGAYTYGGVNISGGDEPRAVSVGLVTGDMFQILGVTAAIGRGITPEDAVAGSDRVVVLGDGLWRTNFGADPSVVGKTVLLDKTAHTVIGVMPPEFNFPFGGVRMWQPIVLDPNGQARDSRRLMGVGRLRPGATRAAAQTELATIASRLTAEYPATNEHQGVSVVSLRKGLIFFFDVLRIGLAVLAMAVGLVLLIACINVANLMLARGMSRRREVAVRAAMGAGRMRIVAQLLTENAVLAMLAGALGVGLAVVAVRPLAGAIPEDLWRSGPVAIDAMTLGFALTVSLATTIVIGLVPALRTTDMDLTHALKEGGRTASGSSKSRRLSNALVVGQLAGALVLLTGATLLIKSVRAMQHIETGFVADPVLTSQVLLSRGNYEDAGSLRVFYRDLFQHLGAAPGIVAAAAVYPLPFNFETAGRAFSIPGREISETNRSISASAHWVTPGYFSAMQTIMLSGRDFTQQDDETAPRLVIINATMAQRYWPGEEAVGKTIVLEQEDRPTATVIGVVADMMGGGLYQESSPQIFASMYQEARRGIFLVARADGAPENLVSTLRAEIRGVDPNLPIGSIRTMNEVLNETMGPFWGIASLLLILAAGALVLASSGIYSVISYSVSQRMHEFGVRAALGASRQSVVRLVLRQGAVLAIVGGAIGLGVAFAVSKTASGFLFGIGAFDPVTFVVLPVFLVGVALVATYIPALRATRVDPMQALRYE
ncbi:MAG: ABC transporter permease, partial [Gemmatimonadetes bacterium]|nr:ABC transporter permease [Gemmatimonadota bacterium]